MKLTFDTSDLQAKLIEPLRGAPERMRTAVAIALTKTGVAVREAERREMVDSFDRPTPFTLNSLYLKPATAADPEARVGIKNEDAGSGRSALNWLRWQINGGLRTHNGFERTLIRGGAMDAADRAIPAAYAKLDAFGNMSRGQMAQIISQLRIGTGLLGSTRVMTKFSEADNAATRNFKRRSIVSQYRRAGGQYLALPEGRGKLRPGIYLIDRFNKRDVQPVLIYVSKAQYEQRFDFAYTAQYTIKRELPANLSGQLARALLQSQAPKGTRVSIA
jgi:hypothetical protein